MRTMKIGEVAARANVPVDTLRYYERRGVVQPLGRRRSGYREYDPSVVTRVRNIKALQGMGFRLDEIDLILADHDQGRRDCARQEPRVGAVMARLDEQIGDLCRVRRHLRATVRRCREGTCALVDQPATARPPLPSRRFRR